MIKQIFSLMALLVFITACDFLDMPSTTKDLKTTTEDMAQTTESLKETSDSLNAKTEALFKQSQTREALGTREGALAILDEHQNSFPAKLRSAGIFMKGLHFQLWTGIPPHDDPVDLGRTFYTDTNEYLRVISATYTHVNKSRASAFAALNEAGSRNEASWYAYAATISQYNDEQLYNAAKQGFVAKSMYDLVEDGLIKGQNDELYDFDSYPHVINTLDNKLVLIELLKARYNLLVSLALKYAFNARLGNPVFEKMYDGLRSRIEFKVGEELENRYSLQTLPAQSLLTEDIEFAPHFEERNRSTKYDIMRFLLGAAKIKGLLAQLNIKVEVDTYVAAVIGHINMKAPRANSEAERVLTESEVDLAKLLYSVVPAPKLAAVLAEEGLIDQSVVDAINTAIAYNGSDELADDKSVVTKVAASIMATSQSIRSQNEIIADLQTKVTELEEDNPTVFEIENIN